MSIEGSWGYLDWAYLGEAGVIGELGASGRRLEVSGLGCLGGGVPGKVGGVCRWGVYGWGCLGWGEALLPERSHPKVSGLAGQICPRI